MSTPTSLTVGGYTSPSMTCTEEFSCLGLSELLKPQPQRLFTHLMLELPVLEESELVLPLQLVSVNVVQVHLKPERPC